MLTSEVFFQFRAEGSVPEYTVMTPLHAQLPPRWPVSDLSEPAHSAPPPLCESLSQLKRKSRAECIIFLEILARYSDFFINFAYRLDMTIADIDENDANGDNDKNFFETKPKYLRQW